MSKGSFRTALANADRELAAIPLPPRRIVISRRRTPARPVLALAGVAVLAGALAIVMRSDTPHVDAPAVQEVAGFTIAGPPTGWHVRGAEIEIVAPALVLEARGFGRIVANRGARLVRIAGGVHVLHGVAEFEVTHRGAPHAIVRVSHGTIAVLGTRFVVEQRDAGGLVQLHEGAIRFEAPGRLVDLRPGESLAWPLVAAIEPAPEPAPPPARVAPAKPKLAPPAAAQAPALAAPVVEPAPPPPAADGNAILAEVASLRARRKFADAAQLLETALADALPPATHERLSYELGAIEAYHLSRTDRACRHWRAHQVRYPQGRYTVEIEAGMTRLGCKEETP